MWAVVSEPELHEFEATGEYRFLLGRLRGMSIPPARYKPAPAIYDMQHHEAGLIDTYKSPSSLPDPALPKHHTLFHLHALRPVQVPHIHLQITHTQPCSFPSSSSWR